MDEATRDGWFANFEALGEDLVRRRVDSGQYAGARLALANQWLSKFDQKSRTRSETSSSDSLRIARSAKNAAWAAVAMAAIAAIIAAVSMVIAYLAFRAAAP